MKNHTHLLLTSSASVNRVCGSPLTGTGKRAAVNEISLARTFAWVEQICWDDLGKTFRCFNASGGFWEATSPLVVKAQLSAFIADYAQKGKTSVEHLHINDAKLRSLLNLVKSESLMPVIEHPGKFPVGNGVVEFKNRKIVLSQQDRALWFTAGCQTPYQPDAECPKFLAMVQRALPDTKDRLLLQMYLGAPFTGMNKTKRMLWIHGVAGTSKSTILAIQEKLLGLEFVGELRTTLLTSRFETSHLIGKRQLSIKEAHANSLTVTGAKTLKSLVGADSMEAEKKFGGKVTFRGNFYVVVISNGELHLALEGDESAWLDRFLVLHFSPDRPAKVIPNYADVLLDKEGTGILRWLLEGGSLYLDQINKAGDLVQTEDQRIRTENLVLASKSLELFVRDCVQRAEGRHSTTDELIQAYVAYCKRRGWRPLSSHQIYSRLPDLMLQIHGATKNSRIERGAEKHKGFSNVIILPA